MFKKLFFPIKRDEWILFGFMFFIASLININFSILRSMRNTLVVADTGGSAAFIPYFELFGTFPASILLTWVLSRLMRVFSFRFIFSTTMLFFLTFFVVFAFGIYPHREQIHALLESRLGFFFGLDRFMVIFTHWPDMVFYIMSELWKVALLSVIFWGFLNQKLSLDQAKRFYPPLLLGSSIGPILAGPITIFCTSEFIWEFAPLSTERWQHSLYLLTAFMIVCGLITLFSFSSLYNKFHFFKQKTDEKKSELPVKKEPFSQRLLSLSSSLRYLLKSKYLASLFLIVIAEYVCYSLGELIFLETLKSKFPTKTEYCQYMGTLSLWMGILTAVSALFITPYLLQTYRWGKTVIITPILMVVVTMGFFFVVYCGKMGIFPLTFAVVLGSIHFCGGRAAKYTLFDAIKELAFIPLNQEGQMKGKLIIDGIGSRMGRGTSSLLSIILFLLMGGPNESILFAGILAIAFAAISLPAARFIGYELEKSTPQPELTKADGVKCESPAHS